MGGKQNGAFHLAFSPSLKVDFQGSRVTSEGGLIPVGEFDKHLGLGDLTAHDLALGRELTEVNLTP